MTASLYDPRQRPPARPPALAGAGGPARGLGPLAGPAPLGPEPGRPGRRPAPPPPSEAAERGFFLDRYVY